MKKQLFAILCLTAIAFNGNAQVKITPAVGLNISNISNAEGTTSKMGLHLGAYVGFKLSDNLHIQPGLFYSQKGCSFKILNETTSLKYNYLEIPVNAVYAFGNSGLSLNAGPYLGMLMSAKWEDLDVKEGMSSMDFGLNIGASIDLPANLMLRLQYGMGMANLDKDGNSKEKNNNFGITLGYRLGN
jgi:hypothetical protein